MNMFWWLIGMVSFCGNGVNGFAPFSRLWKSHSMVMYSSLSSSSSNNNEGEDRSNLDRMRFLLERSWNTNTMGAVPTHPESAAESAGMALSQAILAKNSRVFLVDIALPSMDITLGPNVYDGISAVEFCSSMANTLQRLNNLQSTVFLRNDLTLNSIQSVLSMKQKQKKKEEEEIKQKEEKERQFKLQQEEESKEEEEEEKEIMFFDDFSDFDTVSSTFRYDLESSTTSKNDDDKTEDDDDIDLMKKQLMASWESTETTIEEEEPVAAVSSSSSSSLHEKEMEESVQMASLFGNTVITSGTTMMDQVLDAVKENVVVENEDVLILLSPTTQEEMIAVRKLISQYSHDKYIVLVNHKLNPTPRELLMAETVYSMLPLIANAKSSPASSSTTPNPKIVLMRRYPKDWEIFIAIQETDDFELAASIPAHSVGKRGPSMDTIADCVKQFMTLKKYKQ